MKCSSCMDDAEFKCACKKPYMCGIHFSFHMKSLGKHKFEILDIVLDKPRLLKLKSEIINKIQKINKAEILIVSTTNSLLKDIEKKHKQVLERLDILRKKYFGILEQGVFCKSDTEVIAEIENMELQVKILKIDRITSQIEKVYGVELVSFMEKKIFIETKERLIKEEQESRKKQEEDEKRKIQEQERCKIEEERLHPERSNSFIEMNLKQKIDYFHPIVFKILWNLTDCHKYCREFIVFDIKMVFDIKIVFEMKPVFNIKLVTVKKMKSKKCVNEGIVWQNESLEARQWKDKYPECIYKVWGY